MTLRSAHLPDTAPSSRECPILGSRMLTAMSKGRTDAIGRDRVGRRRRAYFRGEGRTFRGDVQTTTDRGQDKSRQGAARPGLCFCWDLSPLRQCVASGHNVRSDAKTLFKLFFPHRAEAGHGA